MCGTDANGGQGQGQFFFIGPVLKKPQMHVLVQGFPSDMASASEARTLVSILRPGCKQPVCCTSHQAFQQILALSATPLCDSISFCIHQYSLNPYLPLTSVTITATSPPKYFQSSLPKAVRKTSTTRLPFGLQRQTKKRKRRSATEAAGEDVGKAAKCDSKDSVCNRVARMQQQLGGRTGETGRSRAGAASSCASSDSSSSSSSSSSDSCRSDSDDSDADGGAEPPADGDTADKDAMFVCCDDVEIQSAEVALQSNAEQAEERAVQQALASHAALVVQSSNPPGNQPPSVATSSFCNLGLGVTDVGIQKAKRLAACRHCLTKIEHGAVRFAYAYSRTKFHAWLHADCAALHIAQEGASVEQVQYFLRSKLEESNEDAPPGVRKAMIALQRELATK